MAHGDLRLRPHHFQRRQRSGLHLRAVVVVELLRHRQGLLLHLHIFVQTRQIVVQPDHARNRADHLLPENQIGDSRVILGDLDESAVDAGSESAQQGLRDVEPQGGIDEWIVCAAD